MLQYKMLVCRSLTYAQSAARLLRKNGLFAAEAKVPQEISAEGCGYGVKVRPRDADTAISILNEAGITIRRVVGLNSDGSAGEL